MATRALLTEVAADAVLIGRYFGHPAASSALSRAVSAASPSSSASARTSSGPEGDGPGVRMTSPSGGKMVGMMAASGAGAGSVRFMSMFGRMHADDALMTEVLTNRF